jgi:hypothetical protein
VNLGQSVFAQLLHFVPPRHFDYLVYRCARQHSESASDKRGAKVDELTLTPLELIGRST